MKTGFLAAAAAALAATTIMVVASSAAAATTYLYPSAACPLGATGLTACIANASAGDTIRVKPGTYYENVTVAKSVTVDCLTGRPKVADRPVLDAAPPGPPAAGTRGVGLDVTVDDVTIRCLLVRHATDAIQADGYDGLHVANVVIEDANVGVYVNNGDDFVVEKSSMRGLGFGPSFSASGVQALGDDGQVLGNTIVNTAADCVRVEGDRTVAEGNALALCDDAGVRLTGDDVAIRANSVSGAGSEAFVVTGNRALLSGNLGSGDDSLLRVTGDNPHIVENVGIGSFDTDVVNVFCSFAANGDVCDDVLILDNFVQGGDDDSIGLDISAVGSCTSSCGEIRGNTASRNVEEGFLVNASGMLIKRNAASRNGQREDPGACSNHGFRIVGNDNVIESNKAQANTCDGMQVEGDNNTVQKNTAEKNLVDGIQVTAGATNTLLLNVVTKNGGDGIENDGTNTTIQSNKSKGNRADCVGDGTTAVVAGNLCGDGTNFTTGGTID